MATANTNSSNTNSTNASHSTTNLSGAAVGGATAAGDSKKPAGGGGTRKQLPAIPTHYDPVTTPRAPPSPMQSYVSSYGPFFLEYAILAEYTMLQKQRLPGVYVIPSAKHVLKWFGILFIRQGTYQGGKFRFTVVMPNNFPDGDCPKLIFEPPVFHPVIHPETGELDVKRAFPKWRKGVNHIWQVLLYARRVFYKIDTKSPSNPEAAILYEQDLDQFRTKVDAVIKESNDRLYDEPNTDDPHALTFSKFDETVHGDPLRKIHAQQQSQSQDDSDSSSQTNGLSWMTTDRHGRPMPFSKNSPGDKT